MNRRLKRTLSLFVAVGMMLVMLPLGAVPAHAAGGTVEISQGQTISTIQSNIQTAINGVTAGGGTVTVTGSKTGATSQLELTIPAGVTVIWEAELINTNDFYTLWIESTSAGTLEIASGGSVIHTDSGKHAIAGANNLTVIVSGGTVIGNNAISGICHSIEISDGIVSGYLLGKTVAVSGGFVFGYADAVSGDGKVIYATDSYTNTGGVVVAWNKTASPGPFAAGDTTGLSVDPTGAAVWGNNGVDTNGGISYCGGFFPIGGVMVTGSSPIVTGVTVSPGSELVKKGTTCQFAATVTGINNPQQSVTWMVENGSAGTSIAPDGTLTVATTETARTLVVTATSVADGTKSSVSVVTVQGDTRTPFILHVETPGTLVQVFTSSYGTPTKAKFDSVDRAMKVTGTINENDLKAIWDYSDPGHAFKDYIEYLDIGGVTLSGMTDLEMRFGLCGSIQEIILPEGLATVGNAAFQSCTNLESVTFPDSLTSIGTFAFNGCAKLAYVDLSHASSLNSIDSYAFQGCSGLETVLLPESLTVIDHYAFDGCAALTDLTIPSNTTTIGTQAFGGCVGLNELILPEALTSIDAMAFSGCKNLNITITNTDNLVPIKNYPSVPGADVFKNCENITVYVPSAMLAVYEADTDWAHNVANYDVTLVAYNVSAKTPVISTQPVGNTYTQNAAATALTVVADVSDGGNLSYQWYRNSANSNSGGLGISSATASSYTPPTDTAGTVYYYCVVTNTNNNVDGVKTASISSSTAEVIVNSGGNNNGNTGGGGGTTTPPTTPTAPTTDIGNNTVTTPSDKPPVIDENGNATLPGGGTIETENDTIIDAPKNTTVDKDGTITVGDGTATVSLPGGTEIEISEGSVISDNKLTVGADGATVMVGSETYTYGAGEILIFDENVPLGYYVQLSNPYGDIIETSWYYKAVIFAYENGIMQGVGNDLFWPNMTLTRSMMVQILHNLAGKPVAGISDFGDVNGEMWYADAVAWAATNGIVNGVGDNLFAPNADITREQMAVMLYNYCIYNDIELPTVRESGGFADDGSVSAWAAEAVEAMCCAGILNGKGNGVFDPQGTATRAEVAQMFMNFMQAVKR